MCNILEMNIMMDMIDIQSTYFGFGQILLVCLKELVLHNYMETFICVDKPENHVD